MHAHEINVKSITRLDYQPLLGKMSPHSSPRREDQDRTRETTEIEPKILVAFKDYKTINSFINKGK